MTYINAVSPEALVVNVSRGQLAVDFTVATACSFNVKRPDGSTTTWTGTISNATINSITLTHAYLAGELAQAGEYIIVPVIAFASGSILCRRLVKEYTDPFVTT